MPAVGKERLDKIVVDRGLCQSRAQAQALIMDGKVRVKGKTVTKPGTLVPEDEPDIEVAGLQKYVSRGGLKLEKALDVFNVSAEGRVCMDVGAATGGFTDCLLQRGATKVYAVDVGYGQLDWKLRQDSRVVVMEKVNVKDLQPAQLEERPSLGVVDVSFISLKKVLPVLTTLLAPETAEMIALLKPQFEALDYISSSGFKGVVRGRDKHETILLGVLSSLETLLPDWRLQGLDYSPITGPKGNIEFLVYWIRSESSLNSLTGEPLKHRVQEILEESYRNLSC